MDQKIDDFSLSVKVSKFAGVNLRIIGTIQYELSPYPSNEIPTTPNYRKGIKCMKHAWKVIIF